MNLIPGLVSATFKHKSAEDVIAIAVRAGLKAIEWSENWHIESTDYREAGRIGALTAISGLKIAEYGSYYKLGMGMDFRSRIVNATALGARVIRIWGGNKPSSEVSQSEWNNLVDESKRIADEAAEAGITVVLEWHKNTLTDTNDSGKKFIGEVGRSNFRTLWQPSMAMSVEERVDGIRKLGDEIVNLHVFYWDATGRRPLCEGTNDWKLYLEALPVDFKGYALIEFVKDDSIEQFLEDAMVLNGWID